MAFMQISVEPQEDLLSQILGLLPTIQNPEQIAIYRIPQELKDYGDSLLECGTIPHAEREFNIQQAIGSCVGLFHSYPRRPLPSCPVASSAADFGLTCSMPFY